MAEQIYQCLAVGDVVIHRGQRWRITSHQSIYHYAFDNRGQGMYATRMVPANIGEGEILMVGYWNDHVEVDPSRRMR